MRRLLMGASLVVLTGSWALADATMPPYTAEWGPRKGDWEATLGGVGASTNEFDNSSFGIQGGMQYYVLKWLPVGARGTFQTLFGDDVADQYNYSAKAAVDFQAPLGRFQPFIGFSGGYAWGDGVQDDWVWGPEAGVKFFVNESTFLYGLLEYEVVGDNSLDDGNARYSFGFGLNF